MAETPDRKGRIIATSMEGGGVLNLIQLLKLSYDELLTSGRPAGTLYQAYTASSGGAIVTVPLLTPDPNEPGKPLYTATGLVPLYAHHAQEFFKPIPRRTDKMVVSQSFNLIEKKFLDPDRHNAKAALKIQALCTDLLEKVPSKWKKPVGELFRTAGSRWMTTRKKEKMIALCQELGAEQPEFKDTADAIETILLQRKTKGLVSTMLREKAMGAMDSVRKRWAHDFMFSTQIPKATYHKMLGDARLSNAIRAVYIYAYDLAQEDAEGFFCRPDDFLNDDPKAPRTPSRGDDLMVDVIMGTTAHPLGYPPYVTEDGNKVLTDKAHLHTPMPCIADVLKFSPPDVPVTLVLHSTGDYLASVDRKQTWRNLLPEQRRERAQAMQREYAEDGIVGNLLKGRETSEQSRFINGVINKSLRLLLEMRNGKKDNIIGFSPRLVPRAPDEIDQMPSRDILDASPENLLKIFNTAFRMLHEQHDTILDEHAMLIENLHDLGQMTDEEFARSWDINRDEKKRLELREEFRKARDQGSLSESDYQQAMDRLSPPDNPYSIESFERSWKPLADELREQIRTRDPLARFGL